MSIADRLRLCRGLADLSQRELARLAGLTASHVRHLEAGRPSPSFVTLVQIADALGVSLDWLALGRGPPRAKPEADGAEELRPRGRDIIAAVTARREAQRQAALPLAA